MSYLLTATNQSLRAGAGLITAAPLTLSAWIKLVNHADGLVHAAIAIGKLSGGDPGDTFALYTNAGVVSSIRTQAGVNEFATAGTITDENWHHLFAVFASSMSQIVALDGVWGVENTNANTPIAANLDSTLIGIGGDAYGNHFNPAGYIAGVGMWNIDASAYLAGLAAGDHPAKYPVGLVSDPDLRIGPWDHKRQTSWTVTNATLETANPSLRPPRLRGGLLIPGGPRLAA